MVLERFFTLSYPKFRLRFSFESKKEKVEPKERRRKSLKQNNIKTKHYHVKLSNCKLCQSCIYVRLGDFMCVWKTKKFDAFKDKRDVQQFVRKMYRFLIDEHTIEFKYLRSCGGYMIPDENPTTVTLDPRNDMIYTLIHEVLHFVYPNASETWVRKMEPRIYRQLSSQQIRYIETLLVRHMV